MTQRIIALLGISGVGKTTFLRRVQETMVFQHLSAGTLIASASNLNVDRDLLRLRQVDRNQQFLLAGMELAKDPAAKLVVLDGHAVVDGPAGLESVSHMVFRDMGICGIAHLEAAPSFVKRNRQNDRCRARPPHDIDVLQVHQEASAIVSQEISEVLDVPFLRLEDDVAAFVEFARRTGDASSSCRI